MKVSPWNTSPACELRTGAVAHFVNVPEWAQRFTGQGYVYDLSTGADIAQFQFGMPPNSRCGTQRRTRRATRSSPT